DTVAELRRFLQEKLPDYMVPSALVLLDRLPLTENGKVDRKALPEPERGTVGREYVAPSSPAEESLARIWQDVLGVERVGAHDNFFELGGDSILSIQVVARARAAGLGLLPQDLFLHPTVAGLAAAAGTPAAAAVEQGPVIGPVPLTPIQRWFFEDDP